MSTTIGIMGGTFNPIHIGHLVTAEEAYHQFGLDRVIFIPAGIPPHKRAGSLASAEDRYAMTLKATASNGHFEVSRLEIERPGTSYTIDTVRELHRIYGEDAVIYFITGADAIFEILTWKESASIYSLCRFIAATRPGYTLRRFRTHHLLPEKGEPTVLPDVSFMEIPALAISSTDIRCRVSEGRSIRYLVPDSVAAFIQEKQLYIGEKS